MSTHQEYDPELYAELKAEERKEKWKEHADSFNVGDYVESRITGKDWEAEEVTIKGVIIERMMDDAIVKCKYGTVKVWLHVTKKITKEEVNGS